jgi:hypothetical protein
LGARAARGRLGLSASNLHDLPLKVALPVDQTQASGVRACGRGAGLRAREVLVASGNVGRG